MALLVVLFVATMRVLFVRFLGSVPNVDGILLYRLILASGMKTWNGECVIPRLGWLLRLLSLVIVLARK